MSETPRYVGPLGRHAHTLAFGSADLSKVILFNNAGSQGPSGGGGVVDAMIKKASGLNTPNEGNSQLMSPLSGAKDLQVPRDFQIKTAYVKKRRHTTLHGNNVDN
jgi:hypothetical protein